MILTVRPSEAYSHGRYRILRNGGIGPRQDCRLLDYWTMRIRLLRVNSTRDRIEWLSFRGGDDVLNTYEALFPRSVLPGFCRFVFWTAVVVAAVGLCAAFIAEWIRQ